MADRVERTERVITEDEPARRETTQVTEARATGSTIVERVIWYIAGVLLVLLAFRFVLALLGANQSNGFANFIYDTSHPFVSPFFGLFGYNTQYGVSKLEVYTLVAMAVYAIVAWGLAKLVTINRAEAR